MSKFIPSYKCNTHFPNYLDGGINDLPFSWPQVPSSYLSTPNGVQQTSLLSKSNQSIVSNVDVANFHNKPSPNYSSQRKWFVSNLSLICESILGQKVVDINFPGGESRSACRLFLANGNSVIATRRADHGRTLLEHKVLTALTPFTDRIPKVTAFNGVVLIQENLTGTRLSESIREAPEDLYETLFSEALDSIIEIHQASEQAGLDSAVPLLGCDNRWLNGFIDQLDIIGKYLEIPCPNLPFDEIFDLLTIMRPRFIKWDSRPGNAMVDSNGKISWFDWEHCCARNRLDDVVWLLCDDITPYHPDAENRLINTYLPCFTDGAGLEQAHAYLRMFGILHMSVRLGGILSEKGMQPWMRAGNKEFNLVEDPLVQAKRLCSRAADWAKKSICPNSLSYWFLEVSQRLRKL